MNKNTRNSRFRTLIIGGLLAITATVGLAEPGESNSASALDLGGSQITAIAGINAGEEVLSMYWAVFSQLMHSGQDIENLINQIAKASPRIINDITRRWNHPAEKMSYTNYRKIFITRERITAGDRFHDANRELVHNIRDKYQVDEYLLLAIIGVESMYGASHADYRVVDVFHTIAHSVPRKRKWAEKEMVQYLEFCAQNDLDPAVIRGSYAAAIGYAQFIPSSLTSYGIDHNGDGKIDPYTWEDALESVANYLVKNRYQPGSNDFSQHSRNWKAIYAYNHSKNYVRAVLEFRGRLKAEIEG